MSAADRPPEDPPGGTQGGAQDAARDAAETPATHAGEVGARPSNAPPEGALEGITAYQAAQRPSPWGFVFIAGIAGLLTGLAWYRVETDTGIVTQAWIFVSALLTLGAVAWHGVDIAQALVTRRGGAFASVVATVLLGLVVMVVVSAINIRMKTEWGARWTLDLTESRRYTLGEETLKILGQVERTEGTVYATYLQRPSERCRTSPALRKMAMDQLRVYAYSAGGCVVVESFDDFQEGDKAARYLREKGVPSTSAGEDVDVIVFSYAEPGREVAQGKQKELAVEEHAFARMGSADGMARWLGERAITAAIQELVFTRLKAYAVGGHGESGLTDEMRLLRERLTAQSIEVVDRPWTHSETPEVPDDCDLLLVLGPRQPFRPEEAAAIDRWLDKGRTLLVSLDVEETGTRRETGLEELLGKHGIETRINYVVMAPFVNPVAGGVVVQMQPELFVTGPSYGNHPAVAPLRRGTGFLTVFRASSYLEVAAEPPDGVTVDPVVWAPESGQKDVPRPFAARITPQRRNLYVMDPDEDKQGRLPIVAAATRTLPPDASGAKRDARVIVFGDTDALADEVARQYAANLDLVGGLTQWGLRREELVSVSDKTLDVEVVPVGDREHRMAFWWPLVIALLALLAGAAVWWARRR